MGFEVTFSQGPDVIFCFKDGKCVPFDTEEQDSCLVEGTISVDDKTIGQLTLYKLYPDCNLLDICDSISGDCESVASVICGKRGTVLKKHLPSQVWYPAIYILDRICIEDQYRGKGIGSAVIKNLLTMLKYKFGDDGVIFLCAGDFEAALSYGFESQEYKTGCDRLVAFYERLGFKVLKGKVMMYHESN